MDYGTISGRAAVEQFLSGVMEVRADPRSGSQLARTELGAGDTIDAAVPGAEVAVGEHAVGKLPTQLQQARPLRSWQQGRACTDRLPARDKDRHEPVELDPQRFFGTCPGIATDAAMRNFAGRLFSATSRYHDSAPRIAGSSQILKRAKSLIINYRICAVGCSRPCASSVYSSFNSGLEFRIEANRCLVL